MNMATGRGVSGGSNALWCFLGDASLTGLTFKKDEGKGKERAIEKESNGCLRLIAVAVVVVVVLVLLGAAAVWGRECMEYEEWWKPRPSFVAHEWGLFYAALVFYQRDESPFLSHGSTTYTYSRAWAIGTTTITFFPCSRRKYVMATADYTSTSAFWYFRGEEEEKGSTFFFNFNS